MSLSLFRKINFLDQYQDAESETVTISVDHLLLNCTHPHWISGSRQAVPMSMWWVFNYQVFSLEDARIILWWYFSSWHARRPCVVDWAQPTITRTHYVEMNRQPWSWKLKYCRTTFGGAASLVRRQNRVRWLSLVTKPCSIRDILMEFCGYCFCWNPEECEVQKTYKPKYRLPSPTGLRTPHLALPSCTPILTKSSKWIFSQPLAEFGHSGSTTPIKEPWLAMDDQWHGWEIWRS